MIRLPRPSARRTFGIAAVAVAIAALRKQSLGWGATDDEVRAFLPGDEILNRAQLVSTRAITIASKPDDVWPWIAQLGQGRGGFYSYEVPENLIGCDIHSADVVMPQWQDIAVGDEVRLHPEVALSVSIVEPGRALVLRGGVPMGDKPAPYEMTWAFILRAGPNGSTRLVVRERYEYHAWWASVLVEPVELVSFAMSRRMMHGIKTRAE